MSDEYTTFEQDGRYAVSFQSQIISYDDESLGSGGGQQISVFPTLGERAMYISLHKLQRIARNAERERDFYADAIREMSKDGIDGFMRRAAVRRKRRLRREARDE